MAGEQTVAAVLARDLASYGARRCFALLGTANFKISHALAEAGVEIISARHEGNAASMADAYAKATQELTLVSVHSGPGLTNALTGIAEAAKSRTPLLVLAGDVPAGAVKNNFHFDQAAMARSVGAVAERIHAPATAREDTLRAVTRALRDRQTVVLSLPTDVQDAMLAGNLPPLALPPAPGPLHPDPASVRRLAEAIDKARATRIHRRTRRGDLGRGGGHRGAGGSRRGTAGHVGVRARAVCRRSLDRSASAAGSPRRRRASWSRKADLIVGVRSEPDALDDQARQADRAGNDGGADRHRRAEARLSHAGRYRRAGRRARGGGGLLAELDAKKGGERLA